MSRGTKLKAGFEFAGEGLRGAIAPCGGEGGAETGLFRGFEADVRGALAPPAAFYGNEDGGLGADEFFLLLGGELDHGPGSIGVADGCEDFAADAEIGVILVRTFRSFGKAESNLAEFGFRHGKPRRQLD
jgi:hypothetical protein